MFPWEEKLAQIQKENNIAGMAVAVTDREKVIWAGAYGVDNAERPHIAADPVSMYRIASVTKMFVASTVMRLVEQGKLELDTPVVNYVPWLTFSRPEATERMTLRHLLSHTGGLPKAFKANGPKDECFAEVAMREELPKVEMKNLPGDGAYEYANWGTRVAAFVAQYVSGKYFSELCRELVLAPLGMERTTFHLREVATYPVSAPHEYAEDGVMKVIHSMSENGASFASGGLYSNVFDLCKFARMLLNDGKNDKGETVLRPETLALMKTWHGKRDEPGDWYGLNIHMHAYREGFVYGHLGCVPPYATSVFTDPVSGYGVVTLMNTKHTELRLPIPDMIFDSLRECRK